MAGHQFEATGRGNFLSDHGSGWYRAFRKFGGSMPDKRTDAAWLQVQNVRSKDLLPLKGFSLFVAPGAYVQTGESVGLGAGLPVDAGSYTLTGEALGASLGISLAGSYALTGEPLGVGVGLSVTAGAYTLTGEAFALGAGLPVTAGSYTLTGEPLALGTGALFSGSYVLTGAPIGLGAALGLTGSYALSGQAVDLGAGFGFDAGIYAVAGEAFALGTGLGIDSGNYALIGAVSLDAGLPVAAGTYVLTGNDIALAVGSESFVLLIDTGQYIITGFWIGLRDTSPPYALLEVIFRTFTSEIVQTFGYHELSSPTTGAQDFSTYYRTTGDDMEIRQGDYGQTLTCYITATSSPVVLPMDAVATMRMVGNASGHVVTGSATVGNYGSGTRNQLSYTFVSGDTTVADTYAATFTVTSSGADTQTTFPTMGQIRVTIYAQ